MQNVRFVDFRELLQDLGFRLDRQRGSHLVFVHSRIPRPFPVQSNRGQAVPYQVRQLRRLVEDYNLDLDREP